MRLSKTAYLFGKTEITGYDSFDRPIFGNPQRIPFKMESEPYSSEKASREYGVSVVSVQYRMFTPPDSMFVVNTELEYQGEIYSIVDPPKKYDRHFEILIKYERDA